MAGHPNSIKNRCEQNMADRITASSLQIKFHFYSLYHMKNNNNFLQKIENWFTNIAIATSLMRHFQFWKFP